MTDHARPIRTALPSALAVALLLGLAACGSDTVEPPAATATAPAPATTAAAQPAAGAPGPVVEERLSTVNCSQPADGRVFFSVARAVFAVPGGDVRTVLPSDATPTTPASEIVQRLRDRTAQGAGCPESPLQAGLLGVSGPAGDPLLGDAIALFVSQPGAISTPYARLTREMLGRQEGCQQAGNGLIACPATETDGGQQTQSLYFVSTDTNRTLGFGGPLAARCVVADDRIRGCEIVDELPGGVGMRAPLRAVPQSTEALATAHRAALARVSALRR